MSDHLDAIFAEAKALQEAEKAERDDLEAQLRDVREEKNAVLENLRGAYLRAEQHFQTRIEDLEAQLAKLSPPATDLFDQDALPPETSEEAVEAPAPADEVVEPQQPAPDPATEAPTPDDAGEPADEALVEPPEAVAVPTVPTDAGDAVVEPGLVSRLRPHRPRAR